MFQGVHANEWIPVKQIKRQLSDFSTFQVRHGTYTGICLYFSILLSIPFPPQTALSPLKQLKCKYLKCKFFWTFILNTTQSEWHWGGGGGSCPLSISPSTLMWWEGKALTTTPRAFLQNLTFTSRYLDILTVQTLLTKKLSSSFKLSEVDETLQYGTTILKRYNQILPTFC